MRNVDTEDPFIKISSLIGGEEYNQVAKALLKSEDSTDEEIAIATGLRINIIRKVLYDLFGKALITGIRVKDEKKGWFVYRWRAKRDNVDNFIENQKKKYLKDYKVGWTTKNLQSFIIAVIKNAIGLNSIMPSRYFLNVQYVTNH